jgi:hypothetical protein
MAAAAKKFVDRHVINAVYDFAVHGGAISSIDLGVGLPAGAVVIDGFMKVITVPVGSGASIGVMLVASGDVIAVAALSGAPWSTTGIKDVVPVGTAATMIGLTATKQLLFVISAAALTAGKVEICLRYEMVQSIQD